MKYFPVLRYDGTPAADLPWLQGTPTDDPAKDVVGFIWDGPGDEILVYDMNTNNDYTVESSLTCKTPATYAVYDPTTKFL